MSNHVIALASGGTGGHIFPAEALALELRARGHDVLLLTDERFTNYVGNLNDFDVHHICCASLAGNVFKKAIAAAKNGLGLIQAYFLLKKKNVSVVVGFGGYPSFPTMYAAQLRRIRMIIHEQNSLLGQANELLAKRADIIATSFPEVKGISKGLKKKVKFVGNPVRPAVISLGNMVYPTIGEESILHLLITGGSQGATVLSEVVPKAIGLLPEELRSRIRIDQQCRQEDVEKTRAAYKAMNVSADVAAFFTDLPARLANAHLVICRSGASTLAEAAVAGRPLIMVPFPHSKDNHQYINATSVEDVGGGWLVPQESFTPELLSSRLEPLLTLPDTLKEASEKIKKVANVNASKALADCVEGLLKE